MSEGALWTVVMGICLPIFIIWTVIQIIITLIGRKVLQIANNFTDRKIYEILVLSIKIQRIFVTTVAICVLIISLVICVNWLENPDEDAGQVKAVSVVEAEAIEVPTDENIEQGNKEAEDKKDTETAEKAEEENNEAISSFKKLVDNY
jgi:hypothetical protein